MYIIAHDDDFLAFGSKVLCSGVVRSSFGFTLPRMIQDEVACALARGKFFFVENVLQLRLFKVLLNYVQNIFSSV